MDVPEKSFCGVSGEAEEGRAALRARETVFPCREEGMRLLGRRDRRLGRVIAHLGPLRRPVEPDLFVGLVDGIISQQISGKAARTISGRVRAAAGRLTPEQLLALDPECLRACGLSQRKAGYLVGVAKAVQSGSLDMHALHQASDEEVIRRLSALSGIGVWTAEMLLIFSLCRPDVLSWGDLGIRQGMARLYGDRTLTRERFEQRRKRYSPYGSLASLYLWEVAGMEPGRARRIARGELASGCRI